ncbi:hypothetical protein CC78DRAFT_525806 [Lojkania enalia]|uniref:Uncharacterized protein n=1 Tax=Lojkania enalia TaxID=147567 RepID=A0A9P4JXG5_9PLEO|nr:hypothetical protein CC78DRAFT_525806 [Didymosphaeria enalia]
MSSDADYASFLEKANQNTSSVSATTAQASNYGTKSVDDGVEVPEVLRGREEVYVSDADEEFVGVGLRFGGSAVGAGTLFASLSSCPLSYVLLSTSIYRDFDPRGQYKGVVEAVQKAAGGEVRFFRVGLGGTRSEVWIVGVDREGGRLVGVKALVVES